jgi:predicted nucleic acid-binding protein
LIDYLRGRSAAVQFLEGLDERPYVSSISVAELYASVRDGDEREALELFVDSFDVVPVTKHLAAVGGLYRRDFGRSHGTGLADALIAASAESVGARLATLNRKHFPMLPNISAPYRK